MNLCIETGAFQRLPLEEAVEGIREAGYQNVELNPDLFKPHEAGPEDIRRLRRLLGDNGLHPAAVLPLYAIATPDEARRREGVENWKRAIRASRELGAEALTSEMTGDATQPVEACRGAGVLLQVTENYPFMPHDALINRVARSGALGEIAAVYVTDDLNGMSLDIGVHRFAQLRAPVAAAPRRVSAQVRLPNFPGPEAEMTERSFGDPMGSHWGLVVVEFENGALGCCECFPLARAAPVWAPDYRRVIGSQGTLTDDLWPNVFPSLPSGRVRWHRRADTSWDEVPIERITTEVDGRRVLERVVAKTDPPVVTWTSCRVRNGRRVRLAISRSRRWRVSRTGPRSGAGSRRPRRR